MGGLYMECIYRYIDLADEIIKYVGVVWGKTRTLKDRIREHSKEDWCRVRKWRIEYISENIDNRAEAEAFETHYINMFGTGSYYNIRKVGQGINKFLPDRSKDWVEYNPVGILKNEKIKQNTELKKINCEIEDIKKQIENKTIEANTLKEKLYDLIDYSLSTQFVKKQFINRYNPIQKIYSVGFRLEEVELYFKLFNSDTKTTFISKIYRMDGEEIDRCTLQLVDCCDGNYLTMFSPAYPYGEDIGLSESNDLKNAQLRMIASVHHYYFPDNKDAYEKFYKALLVEKLKLEYYSKPKPLYHIIRDNIDRFVIESEDRRFILKYNNGNLIEFQDRNNDYFWCIEYGGSYGFGEYDGLKYPNNDYYSEAKNALYVNADKNNTEQLKFINKIISKISAQDNLLEAC